MAFTGESRKECTGPWSMYLCLTASECKSLLPVVEKVLAKAEKRYEHFRDVMDGGEATTRQQTLYMEAEENKYNLEYMKMAMLNYIDNYSND